MNPHAHPHIAANAELRVNPMLLLMRYPRLHRYLYPVFL